MTRTFDVRASEDLAELQSRMRRGSRLCITVGPPVVQVKRLDGIPATDGARGASRLVRENVNTFFLRASDRIEVADAAIDADGQMWAAVYDRGALDAIAESARSSRGRLVCVAPRADLLPESLRSAHRWYRRSPLAWYPRSAREATRRLRLARGVACAIVTMCPALAAVAAPAMHYRRFMEAHALEAARARSLVANASRTRAETARISRELTEMLAFREGRNTIPIFLSALGEALPDSTALISLRLDVREGSITAIAPNAAALLTAFDSVRGVEAPHLTGALTSEVIGGVRFQRTTIRFRRKHAGA